MGAYREDMEPVQPLREVFGALAGAGADAAEQALDEAGHGDLPSGLVAEAVASYADTAPIEVAEHLAPFVTTYRATGENPDPDAALNLLVSAPLPEPDLPTAAPSLLDAEVQAAPPQTPGEAGTAPVAALDFGSGESGLGGPVDIEPPTAPGDEPPPTPEPGDLDPSFPQLGEEDLLGDLWSPMPTHESPDDSEAAGPNVDPA